MRYMKEISSNLSRCDDVIVWRDIHNKNFQVGLLRRFHFSSSQQSMGVIARVLGQPQMVYFAKGAPEKVNPQ